MARILPNGRLVYGMQLPVQSQSTIYAEGWEAAAGPGDLVEIARAADRGGFAYIACCEHIAIPRRLAGPMGTVWYDPVATLSFLAGDHRAGPADEPCRGRRAAPPPRHRQAVRDLGPPQRRAADPGGGAGHVREEFEAVGADFARRGAVLDETIDALRAALGPEEYPEFQGERFAFSGLGQRPRPAQRARTASGWAGRRPPQSAGPRCAGTAGCRRGIRGSDSRPR